MAISLPSLPALPRSSRASKPLHPCACGKCGGTTRATWTPGHDGHCTGWAIRVLDHGMPLADVPDAVRAGVMLRLKVEEGKRKAEAGAVKKTA